MLNFLSSSIGKKLIMSLSGLFLIVFLVVHLGCNLTALISRDLYMVVCEFMDQNPLIRVMVPVLALGFIVHILFSMWVEFKNWTGRPREMRYAVKNRTQATSWASKNMFVLGVIVVVGLFLHMFHFWAHMQLISFANLFGLTKAEPEIAYDLVAKLFECPCYCILYIVWVAALYYHVSHGFWSAFQTIGLSNSKWIPRLQILAKIYAVVIGLGFISLPVFFFLKSHCGCC